MLCCVSRKAAGGCGGGGVDDAAAAAAKDTMGPARCSVARFILDPMRRRNFKTVKSSGKSKRDQEADEEEERALKKLDDAVRGVAMVASTFGTFKGQSEQPLQATFAAQRVDEFADYYYDGRAESLEPCGVCGRKFNPRSLEKHMPICERTAAKKRKPFDSAKQRIKGTELAEFLPKQKSSSATLSSSTDHLSTSSTMHMGHSRRPSLPQVDDRPLPTSGSRENQPWRQKREEFIKAIRAARGEDSQPSSQPSSHRSNHHQHHQQQQMQQRPSTLSLVSSHGAPQRANEKGQCPTCQRQFGVKSYDRHVAFCRERATRVPASPQVTNNVAKERLDARMKYRAPALKNRKLTMKEKYAPGGPHKVPQSPIMSRSALAAKEHKNEPKLPTLKRPSQTNKETPISSPATTPHSSSNNGPLKSRAIDRSNRDSDSQESLNLAGGLKQMFSSRRLLLLSEVLPSKILKSKLSMSSSSSQKSTSGLFPDLTGGKEQNCPEPPADGSKNLLRKLRKKSKLKKADAAAAAQSEEIDDKIDMITEDDFLAWKQAQSEKLKSNSNEGIELVIDKEDEPFNYDTQSSLDGGNSSTLDEFEHTERVTKYTEERRKLLDSSDGCEEKSQDFTEKKTLSKEEPVLNTTYVIDKAENSLKKQQQDKAKNDEDDDEEQEELKVTEINRQVEKIDIRADDTEDEDALSNASTVTFVNKERSLVIAANEADDYRLLKSNTADDAMMMTMMRDRIEQQQQLQQRSSKDGKKIEDNNCHESGNELPVEITAINRPKKYHSLPNISDMRVKGADFLPAIVKVDKDDNNRSNLMADRIKPLLDPRDIETQTTPMSTARRSASYVISDKKNAKSSHHQQHRQQHRYHYEQKKAGDESSKKSAAMLDEDACSELTTSICTTDAPSELSETDFTEDTEGTSATTAGAGSHNPTAILREIEGEVFKSKDSMMDILGKLRGLEKNYAKKRTSLKPKRSAARSSGRLETFAEESSPEKEICSLTRVDVQQQQANSNDNNEVYLPSICGPAKRSSRREKTRRARFALDLETPREEEEDLTPRVAERNSGPGCVLQNSDIKRKPDCFRGSNGDYNPFLLAEQQFNELFSESDQSSTDGSSQSRSSSQRPKPNSTPNSPFANSAFVQYPPSSNGSVSSSSTRQVSPLPAAAPAPSSLQPTTSCVEPAILASADKAVAPPAPPRLSAPPPPPFDDLTSSDISGSDCTESTNSLTRSDRGGLSSTASSASRHLGRRMIIDPSQALGGGEFAPVELDNPSPVKNSPSSNGAAGNIISRLNRQAPIQQLQQQQTNRSNSMRSISAPKPPERKLSSSSSSGSSEFSRKAPFAKPMRALPGNRTNNTPVQQHHTMNHRIYRNNYPKYSNGSLSSIIAPHESELKRSNSLFDDLLSSFEDDTANSCSTFPSLISMMRNDISSSMMLPSVSQQQQQQQQQNGSHGLNGHQQQQQQRSNNNGNGLNGSRINHSDEDDVELSSPESVKKQECNGKLSADSAYSSLNRKYSSHVRSTNDVSGSFNNKCKLAVYCHQCGERFPDLAKFCCECGIKRLAL
ncbi:hypothetical protein TKK_0012121 [Trichogramma kaykai]